MQGVCSCAHMYTSGVLGGADLFWPPVRAVKITPGSCVLMLGCPVQVFAVPPAMFEALQADSKAAAGKPQATSTAAAAKAAAAKHGAARMSAADEAAAAEQPAPPEPCSLLSPVLASVLNPLVLFARKAACLPDLPASLQQLDTLCEGVKLRAVFGTAQVSPAMHTQQLWVVRHSDLLLLCVHNLLEAVATW